MSDNSAKESVIPGIEDSLKEGDCVESIDDAPAFPDTGRLALILFTICVASFLCGLGQTIVATAVPQITDDFNALGDIAWWTSAYLLTSATLQLVYGRLYSYFSVKRIYILALLLFSLGSVICTVAPNSIALIVGRAIAGCGAAGIMSGSVLVLAASCPLEKRAALSGLLFGSLGIASVAGPFIGGALTDDSTWRWCFGINLPICTIIIGLVCFFVKTPLEDKISEMSWKDKIVRFDIPGTLLLTASLVCIILGLQLGGSIHPWSDDRVIACFAVSGVLLFTTCIIHFCFPGLRSFPTTIIMNRNVVLAALYSGFISGGMFVAITYLPVWFQAVRDASALRSGVMVTPLIASFVVMSALSGGLTQAIGYYNPAMLFGSILAAIGGGLLTTFNVSIAGPSWISFQVLYGFGAGAGVPPPMLVVQTVLGNEDVPLGVSLVNLTQMLCASIVVAVGQAVFVNKLGQNIVRVLPDFDMLVLARSGAAQLDLLYGDNLPTVLPAYSDAITESFYIVAAISGAAFLCALGIQWKSMKKAVKRTKKAPGV